MKLPSAVSRVLPQRGPVSWTIGAIVGALLLLTGIFLAVRAVPIIPRA